MRYNQLFPLIDKHKPTKIVEVGTWNGHRAIALATQALRYQTQVHYLGFDLFEDATPESDARELNVKKHHSLQTVGERLDGFAATNPGFSFQLFKGNTREMWADPIVKEAIAGTDLAFIDGGHAIDTIQADFDALKHAKVVVLDDFYEPDGGHPDTARFGCNFLVENDSNFLVLPDADPVKGGGKVRMAVLPRKAWPGEVTLQVKTKNCVDDPHIQANIRYNMTLIDRWIAACSPHNEIGVLISGGPSFSHFDDVLRTMRRRRNVKLFCVKTSHDKLIAQNIIPWGCLLLDPRAHVQDFIDTPHPKVRYFVASMCHPTTVDRLLEKKAQIWGYHAHVGAGEQDVIKSMMPKGAAGMMLGGGSTAAIRGISVLHALGFRKFEMFGYDSCYPEKPDETHGAKKKEPFKVKMGGREWWSDAELIAQAQDFRQLMEQQRDLDITVHGSGIISHMWSLMRPNLPSFSDLFDPSPVKPEGEVMKDGGTGLPAPGTS